MMVTGVQEETDLGIQCAVFGDLNIRPLAPYQHKGEGAPWESPLDSNLGLHEGDLKEDRWDRTQAWSTAPYSLSRATRQHPVRLRYQLSWYELVLASHLLDHYSMSYSILQP
jgi:hypothetical protein